jgi:hypothetical protein
MYISLGYVPFGTSGYNENSSHTASPIIDCGHYVVPVTRYYWLILLLVSRVCVRYIKTLVSGKVL